MGINSYQPSSTPINFYQLFPYICPITYAKLQLVLSLFRTNQVLSTIFVLFFAALMLAAPVFLQAKYVPTDYGVAYHYLNVFINGKSSTALIIALVFLFLGAFTINYIDLNFRLSKDINMMPGLFYVLISCTAPQVGPFSPLHGGNFFLLLALHELMDTFKKNSVSDRVFNAGFFLAIASFFYPSYLVFIVLIFVGLNVMRGFNFRERLMAVCGLIVPYVLLGVGMFWFDQFELFWRLQITRAFGLLDFDGLRLTVSSVLEMVVFGILLLALIFQQGRLTGKRVIQSQKRINLVYWTLFIAILSVPVQANLQLQHLMILAPGAGLLAGMLFSSMSRNWAEFLHLVWFALVLVVQYQAFIFPG